LKIPSKSSKSTSEATETN